MLTLLLCSLTKINATVVYVDSANVAGFQNGTSWATAYSSFQAGINAANAGDSVWVAKATYMPAAYTSFTMKDSVKIFGGFLNTDTSFAQRNCTNNVTILKNDSSYTIENYNNGVTSMALIDGFTIEGLGNVNGNVNGRIGIRNYYASPSVKHCIFSNFYNALYLDYSSPFIDSCVFLNNILTTGITFAGAAIYMEHSNPTISNSSFTNNKMKGNYVSYVNGGALYSMNSSPIITNCTFANNRVSGSGYSAGGSPHTISCYGGAIYAEGGAPIISNCTFTGNQCSISTDVYNYGGGGAICIIESTAPGAVISGCTFNNNSSINGGGSIFIKGMSTISKCTFIGNTTPTNGGGIYLPFSSPSFQYTIDSCIFYKNKAHSGGGIYIEPYFDMFTTNFPYSISRCLFMKDTAIYGGGIYAGIADYSNPNAKNIIINCLIYGNYASNKGGGIYTYGSSGVILPNKIVNCTITDNTADTSGGGIYNADNSALSVSNTIVYGNSSGIVNDGTSSASVFYSLIQGYPAVAANHIIAGTTDPLFVDTPNGNYALQAGSPCINQGNNDSIPTGITTDLAGHARIYGATVDLGAYEYIVLPPVVALGNDTSVCSGSTLTLDAGNAGSSYVWSTGATTQTINVTTAGSYFVNVTNAEGTASDTIQVSILSLPVVNLGNDTTICTGNSITLNAGNAGATYLWSTGATTQTISADTTGNYSVTVTNTSGCAAVDSSQITVAALPVVNLGNDTTICSGNSVTLSAGNAGATYLWSTGATTQTISASTTGNYSVTVTNTSGCSAIDSSEITVAALPVVNLGNDTTICSGNSITLSAGNSGATYLWSTGATTQTISASTTGNYSVTVTNTSGCSATDSSEITVAALPVVNLGNDTTICSGNSVTLDAGNAGATFLWNTSVTTQTITASTTGTYSVTVTNTNGCSAVDSSHITVAALPVVNLGNDTTICSGNSLTLNAGNSGATYLWGTGATTQTISASTAGNYSVTVTNASGCSAADTAQITVVASPVVNLGNDVTIPGTGNTYTLDAGNPGCTYLWSTGATTQTITVNTTGTYSVVATNANGCSDRDTIQVKFTPTGINDISLENGITISPNPTKGHIILNVKSPALLKTQAYITDVNGKVLKRLMIQQKTQTVSLSGFADGTYFLRLESGKTFKIVKE